MKELEEIIQRMKEAGETEEDIAWVVEEYKARNNIDKSDTTDITVETEEEVDVIPINEADPVVEIDEETVVENNGEEEEEENIEVEDNDGDFFEINENISDLREPDIVERLKNAYEDDGFEIEHYGGLGYGKIKITSPNGVEKKFDSPNSIDGRRAAGGTRATKESLQVYKNDRLFEIQDFIVNNKDEEANKASSAIRQKAEFFGNNILEMGDWREFPSLQDSWLERMEFIDSDGEVSIENITLLQKDPEKFQDFKDGLRDEIRDRYEYANQGQTLETAGLTDYQLDKVLNNVIDKTLQVEKAERDKRNIEILKEFDKKNEFTPSQRTEYLKGKAIEEIITPEKRNVAQAWSKLYELQRRQQDGTSTTAAADAVQLANEIRDAKINAEYLTKAYKGQNTKSWFEYVDGVAINKSGNKIPKNSNAIDISENVKLSKAELADIKSRDFSLLQESFDIFQVDKFNFENKLNTEKYNVNVNGPQGRYSALAAALANKGYKEENGTVKNVLLRDMVALAQYQNDTWGKFDQINPITEKDKDKDLISQGSMYEYVNILAAQAESNQAKKIAYEDVYLLNIDPASIERSGFFEAGIDTSVFDLGTTESEGLDVIEDIMGEAGITPTSSQKENFKKTLLEESGEILFSLPKIGAEFYLANQLTGGLATLSGLNKLQKGYKAVNTFASRTKALSIQAAKEAFTMELVTGDAVTGAGFAIAGSQFAKLSKILGGKFSGVYAPLNNVLLKPGQAGLSFTTASQASSFLKAATDDLIGKQDFKTFMDEKFSDIPLFDEGGLGREYLGELMTGYAFGLARVKKYDISLLLGKGEVVKKGLLTQLQKERTTYKTTVSPDGKKSMSVNKNKINKLQEALSYVDNILFDMQQKKASIDPKLTAVKVSNDLEVIQKRLKKETGQEFEFEVRENGENMGGKPAEFRPKGPNGKPFIIVDASKYKKGMIPHEVVHFVSKDLGLNSPEAMGRLRNILEPTINKAIRELEGLESFDLKKEIAENYGDQSKLTRPEEYITNVIELLQKEPRFRQALTRGTILGDLKQKVVSVIERRFKGTPLEGQKIDFKNPTELLQFLDRLGSDMGKVGSGKQIQMLKNLVYDGKRIFDTNTNKYTDNLSSRDVFNERLTTPEEKKISERNKEIARINAELNKNENLVKNDKGELVPSESTKLKLIENNMQKVMQLANKAKNNPNILSLEQGKRISPEDWISGYKEQLIKLVNTYRPEKTYGDFGAYMMKNLPSRYGDVLKEIKKGDVQAQTLEGTQVKDIISEEGNTFENLDLSVGNRKKLTSEERKLIAPISFLTKGRVKEGEVLENIILRDIEGIDLSKKTYSDLTPSPQLIDAISDIFAGGKKLRFKKEGGVQLTPEGKPKTFKANKETIDSQKEFIRENAKTLYNMLPYAAKKRAVGLKTSTKIKPVIVRNLYEKGERVNQEIGTTAGLAEQVKPPWSPKVEKRFLALFGANKGAKASRNQKTAIKGLIEETAKSTLNSVARIKSVTKEDLALYQQIADGKSDFLASLDINLPSKKFNVNKIKLAAGLLADNKFLEASAKYPIETRILDSYVFEKKQSEGIDLKSENPTFKNLSNKWKKSKNQIKTEKFGEVLKDEILDDITGSGMRKVQKRDGKKIRETYDIDRITKQVELAKSYASTLPKELSNVVTLETLLQSLGSGTYATGRNIKNVTGTPKIDLKTGKKISEFPVIKNQSSQLLEALGTGKITKAFEGLLDFKVSGIGQQKTSFKNLLTKAKTEQEKINIIKRTVSSLDNKAKKELYNAFQTSLQEWLYSSKNKKEFIDRAKFIFQTAADNSSLVMGFGRQLVGVEAVLFESSKKLTKKEKEKLKIEHLKSSLKQSFDAATAVVEGRWKKEGPEITKDYTGVLSYKKYLDVIDRAGGTTNLAGRDRMTFDFENLKKYRTVESDFTQTLYDKMLIDAAKEFNTTAKLLGEKYLIDDLALYGFLPKASNKLILQTAIKNKKENLNTLNSNKKLAKQAKIGETKDLSNLQIVEKLKEKDKTNQEELIESYASKDLDLAFNEIIEVKTGIGKEKVYSKAKAAVVGAKSGKVKLIASSAQDFEGLMYRTLGKGKIGETQKKFYEQYLYRPLAQAEANLATDRVTMSNNFRALKKQLKISPRNLRKNIEGEPWSVEQAVRTYIWDKQGMTIPNISKSDLKLLTDFVKKDPKLEAYAEEIILLGKGTPYAEPGKYWEIGSITSDLIKNIQSVKRLEYLKPFLDNAETIFSEKNLNKLEAAFGTKYRQALENSLARIKAGKNRLFFNPDSGNALERRVLDYVNNSVGTVMFFNTRSAVLQTISAANFVNWKDNNLLAAGKAFANQPQYWKDFSKLMNSDYLVDRRQGIKLNVAESEIADAVHGQTNKAAAALNYILKKGFLPTQFADSFAIASGGATFYRNRIKKYVKEGMSTKEAEKKAYIDFMDIAEASQQSSKAQRISMQQASNLGRIVLAFANTPSQYLRLTQKAASDLLNNRGSKVENISKMAYYSMVQNLLFTTLQQAAIGLSFDYDEDDAAQAKEKLPSVLSSAVDNLARGAGIAGTAAVTAKSIAMKVYKESLKNGKNTKYQDSAYELLNFSPPIRSKIQKLRSAGRTFDWNQKEIKEKGWDLDNPAYLAGANVVSAFTNVPLDRVVKKVNNLKGAMDEENEMWQRIGLLGGWSAWELEIEKEKTKKTKKPPKKKTKKKKRKSKF